METVSSVLNFWFGSGESALESSAEKSSIWWLKNEQVDREITERFADVTEEVNSGTQYSDWRKTTRGCLASIICLDQFPRNMYRNTPRSFAYDSAALGLTQFMVESGVDQDLMPVYRTFVYLPYEHSENLSDQELSVRLYESLVNIVHEDEKPLFQEYLGFAISHYEIIKKFSRFPHRNKILGRVSSEEEKEFLTRPGSSF